MNDTIVTQETIKEIERLRDNAKDMYKFHGCDYELAQFEDGKIEAFNEVLELLK